MAAVYCDCGDCNSPDYCRGNFQKNYFTLSKSQIELPVDDVHISIYPIAIT